MSGFKTISLNKGFHRFVIKYEVGSEPEVMDAIAAMIGPELGFTFDDAMRLSSQVSVNMVADFLPNGKH